MMRMATMLFTIFVACSYCIAQETPQRLGSLQPVAKTTVNGVKAMVISESQNSLLISDGTILPKDSNDLELLALSNLKRTASFKVTDEMSKRYPWSSRSLALSPNGSSLLLYNQFIDLTTMQTRASLKIWPVVGRPNVSPEPWSISPNGERALVLVSSYWSSDESTAAIFDLKTGESVEKLEIGKAIASGSACFLDDDTVVSVGRDGTVKLYHLKLDKTEVLSQKTSQHPNPEGKNLRLTPFDNGKKLLVSGYKEVYVLDMEERKMLYRWKVYQANAMLTSDEKLILWQTYRLVSKTKSTEYLLLVANVENGKIVAEFRLPTFYRMLEIDDTSEFIYGAHNKELHKLKINLNELR